MSTRKQKPRQRKIQATAPIAQSVPDDPKPNTSPDPAPEVTIPEPELRMYVGPSLLGVATRNTIYSEPPVGLKAAIRAFPWMSGLCVTIPEVSEAVSQIQDGHGAIYSLYSKACESAATIQAAVH